MASTQTGSKALPLRELSVVDCLDEAFTAARSLLGGRILVFYLLLVGGMALLGIWGWQSRAALLLLTHDPGADPELLRHLTLGRLGLEALGVVFAVAIIQTSFARHGRQLPHGAGPGLALVSGFTLAPLLVILLFLPEFLLFGGRVAGGSVALLPAAWLEEGAPPALTFAAVLGLWFWPLLQLAPAVLVVEHRGPLTALLRSIALSLQARGRVHFIAATWLAIHLLWGVGLAWLAGALLDPAGGGAVRGLGSVGLFPFGDMQHPLVLSAGMLLVEALLLPQRSLSFYMAYLDLTVRKEGLDVVAAARRAGLLEEEQGRGEA